MPVVVDVALVPLLSSSVESLADGFAAAVRMGADLR